MININGIDIKKRFLLILISISIISIRFTNDKDFKNNTILNSSETIIPNNEYHFSYYYASNLFSLNFSSNINASLNLNYDSLNWLSLGSKQLRLDIESSNSLEFNFTALFNWSNYINNFPEDDVYNNFHLEYEYNTVYRISSNYTISRIGFQFIKTSIFGLDQDSQYSIAYYTNQSDLRLMDTREIEGIGYNYMEGSIENLQANENYYITIYRVKKIITFDLPLVVTLSILIPVSIISIITLISVISKKDYIRRLKNKSQIFPKGVHRLTIDEVLENENRSKIIDIILDYPGIHHSELLRKTNLTPGNLVWHLEILSVYKVIKKEMMENYVIYFPYYDKNPISNIDLKLQKSEFTLKILKIIEDNPGIWNNKIAETLNISRKTIGYHIIKLKDLGLVYNIKKGSKNTLHPDFASEYFSKKRKNEI